MQRVKVKVWWNTASHRIAAKSGGSHQFHSHLSSVLSAARLFFFFCLLLVYRHQPFAMLQGSVLLTQTVRQRPGPCWKDGIPSGLRTTTVVALRSGSLAGGAAEDEGEGGIQPEGQLGRRQTPLWKYWPKCSSETHTHTRSKIKNAANRQSSACKGLPILHSCRLACSPQKRALH